MANDMADDIADDIAADVGVIPRLEVVGTTTALLPGTLLLLTLDEAAGVG